MLLPHAETPPFALVAPSELASILEGPCKVGVNPPRPRGLCAFVDYGTIRPGVVLRNTGLLTTLSCRREQAVARPYSFHVISVLVQVGMARLCTGTVIAHELMRAYLRMRGVRSATEGKRDVEEGLCSLMAYLWSEHQPPQVRRAFTHTHTH